MKEIEKKLHVQEGSPQDNRKNSPPLEGCPQDGVVRLSSVFKLDIKGKGTMKTYFLEQSKPTA